MTHKRTPTQGKGKMVPRGWLLVVLLAVAASSLGAASSTSYGRIWERTAFAHLKLPHLRHSARRDVCPLRLSRAASPCMSSGGGRTGGGGEDWRSFRARLVAQEKDAGAGGAPAAGADLGEWVYDAGDVVEQGSVILGGTEMNFG